jgi:pimeloyl-ACP methyl ester carboxylesterase
MVSLIAALGCTGHSETAPAPSATTSAKERPLPTPVQVRQEPEGVTLADPAFKPRLGARADFGRLGGAVYQIEVPPKWNGRLVLFMHGYEELRPEAGVSAPDIRGYLIGHGYAWGASSFSSTSQIPGRAADETAALWDYFAQKYGRPTRTYITGQSMGGAASHIAAERYANRFDGALALCGGAGLTPGLRGEADYFVAAAYVAGVTQSEFDASTDIGGLVRDRILPALRDPVAHQRFESIMLDLTGGPRRFDREGFRMEEDTNWQRAELLVGARLAPNRDRTYRLGPLSTVTSEEFNRAVIRMPTNDELLHTFVEGNDITGALKMPLLTLHTTGDWQVPIDQARILQGRVNAAGMSGLLVQRVVRDPGHCGFTSTEWEASLEDLVRWVEHGAKPDGTNVLAHDLRKLHRTFELNRAREPPKPTGSRAPASASSSAAVSPSTVDRSTRASSVQSSGGTA